MFSPLSNRSVHWMCNLQVEKTLRKIWFNVDGVGMCGPPQSVRVIDSPPPTRNWPNRIATYSQCWSEIVGVLQKRTCSPHRLWLDGSSMVLDCSEWRSPSRRMAPHLWGLVCRSRWGCLNWSRNRHTRTDFHNMLFLLRVVPHYTGMIWSTPYVFSRWLDLSPHGILRNNNTALFHLIVMFHIILKKH